MNNFWFGVVLLTKPKLFYDYKTLPTASRFFVLDPPLKLIQYKINKNIVPNYIMYVIN